MPTNHPMPPVLGLPVCDRHALGSGGVIGNVPWLRLMMRPQFTLRALAMHLAIWASFAALVDSFFGDSLSAPLLPLVIAVALVTIPILTRAIKGGRTSALGLIGTGATAATSTTIVFVGGATIVWSAFVYADDSKRFLISPWVVAVYLIAVLGSIAGVSGAITGLLCHIGAKRRLMNGQLSKHDIGEQ